MIQLYSFYQENYTRYNLYICKITKHNKILNKLNWHYTYKDTRKTIKSHPIGRQTPVQLIQRAYIEQQGHKAIALVSRRRIPSPSYCVMSYYLLIVLLSYCLIALSFSGIFHRNSRRKFTLKGEKSYARRLYYHVHEFRSYLQSTLIGTPTFCHVHRAITIQYNFL